MWFTLWSLAARAVEPVSVPAAPGPAPVVAFVGAEVRPVSGPIVPDGVVIVRDGKLAAVGPRASTPIPAGAEVRDVTGKVIVPGLVDTHSHVGASGTGELNEMSGPLQPQVSAIDTIDATHPSLQLAQAGGITTVNVMPGSGTLIGGHTAYLKLRDAPTVDELLYCAERRRDEGGTGCGGLKMANGTNPQGEGGFPRTRMGAAAQVRAVFEEARAAAESKKKPHKAKAKATAKAEGKPAAKPAAEDVSAAAAPGADDPGLRTPVSGPKRDFAKDPIAEVLRGDRIVHYHTHRADDIVTILALAREYGFRPVLHHVSEGWKVAGAIAAAGVPCSVIALDSPGGKEEALEMRLETAAILDRAGVKVALHTDDPITDSRLFLRSGALAIRGGLPEDVALRALTLNGAEMLGLDARVGSLDPGKDADLVVLSGPPFSIWTHVEQTWVDGVKVFDRSDPVDVRYATGGWEAGARYPSAVGAP